MGIRFAVPVFFNDTIYTHAEIIKPTGAVLADTRKVSDSGDFFSINRVFCIGCIESITTSAGQIITDKIAIKSIVSKMPNKTAEQIALAIIQLYYAEDDGVEGVYPCPRCNNPVIAELKDIDGLKLDTRDFISQLEIRYYEGNGIIEHQMAVPVSIKNTATGEVIEQITSFTMRFPTIEDGINAFQRYGTQDLIRLQFAMFVQAITHVNGEPVKSSWKSTVGMMFFEGIKDVKKDIEPVVNEINSYGVIPNVRKICPKCGKEWDAIINTSNFFDSALQSV
jgi:ribosomal protein S27AE